MPAKPAVINRIEDLTLGNISNQNIKNSTSNVQLATISIKISALLIFIPVLKLFSIDESTVLIKLKLQ